MYAAFLVPSDPDHLVESRASVAAAGRALRFLVHRDALDHPPRHHLVRRPGLAEDLVVDDRQPRHRVEVEYVRVLVRRQAVEPVVVVVELGEARRAGGVQVDLVARQHAGEAVRTVGVVDEDDDGLLRRLVIERRREREMRALGDHRDTSGDVVERCVVVDDEMIALDGPVLARRVAGLRGCRRGRGCDKRRHHTRVSTDTPRRIRGAARPGAAGACGHARPLRCPARLNT
jgi:hypothetical protein